MLAATESVPLIITNTIVGGVFGILSTLALTALRYGKPKALDILNGSLGGLVAVTASCDLTVPWMAAIIGFVGGLVVIYVIDLLEKFRLDDAVGAIPVHLGAGPAPQVEYDEPVWPSTYDGVSAAHRLVAQHHRALRVSTYQVVPLPEWKALAGVGTRLSDQDAAAVAGRLLDYGLAGGGSRR